MQAFARFALAVQLPPNPVRSLDNQLSAMQSAGRDVYFNNPSDGGLTCNACHTLDASQGFFGSGGLTTFEAEPQLFKVAHLRNAYQKVGMFGMPAIAFLNVPLADQLHQGDQVRGFGFLHDGSVATAFDFLHANVFSLATRQQTALEQFILAFDTTFAPIVGQQITIRSDNAAAVAPRVDLLIARAGTSFTLVDQPNARECDLIVKGIINGETRGYVFDPQANTFRSDRATEPRLSTTALRALASDAQPITFTCVPPGSGIRAGIDRDEDGYFDRDELDAGSDPADPTDVPAICPGDCDGKGTVSIDELIRAVAIALELEQLDGCANVDTNRDGMVKVNELIAAVQRALNGCTR
jgi:hypothetical protein